MLLAAPWFVLLTLQAGPSPAGLPADVIDLFAAASELQDAPPERPPAEPRPGQIEPRHPRSAGSGTESRPPRPPRDGDPRARRAAPPPVEPETWDAVLRVLDDRRPGLARRLRVLREREPERANAVLTEALAGRIEEALDDGPRRPGPLPGGRRPNGPPARDPLDGPPPDMGEPLFPPPHDPLGPPPGDGPPPPLGPDHRPPPPPPDPRVLELQEQQAEADRRARELANTLRTDGARLSDPERANLRDELRQVVETQFELRTALRTFELERIREDLDRLQRRVDALHAELERRADQRAAIIERRMRELLGREDRRD